MRTVEAYLFEVAVWKMYSSKLSNFQYDYDVIKAADANTMNLNEACGNVTWITLSLTIKTWKKLLGYLTPLKECWFKASNTSFYDIVIDTLTTFYIRIPFLSFFLKYNNDISNLIKKVYQILSQKTFYSWFLEDSEKMFSFVISEIWRIWQRHL